MDLVAMRHTPGFKTDCSGAPPAPGKAYLAAVASPLALLLFLCSLPALGGDELGFVKGVRGGSNVVQLQFHAVDRLRADDYVSIVRYVAKLVHPVTGAVTEEQIKIIGHAKIQFANHKIASAEITGEPGEKPRIRDRIFPVIPDKPGTRHWIAARGKTIINETFENNLNGWSRFVGNWDVHKGKMRVTVNSQERYSQIMTKKDFGPNHLITFNFRAWYPETNGRVVINLHDPIKRHDPYFFRIDQNGIVAYKDGHIIASNKNFELNQRHRYTVSIRREAWHLSVHLDGVPMLTYLDLDYPMERTKLGIYIFHCKANFDDVKVVEFPMATASKAGATQFMETEGKVIHVNPTTLWVNLDNKAVEVGQKFPVARRGSIIKSVANNRPKYAYYDKVGEIEIIEAGAVFSQARITTTNRIAIGDEVFLQEPDSTESWRVLLPQ
jgi:uncharacterized protein YdeI (BOF family)